MRGKRACRRRLLSRSGGSQTGRLLWRQRTRPSRVWLLLSRARAAAWRRRRDACSSSRAGTSSRIGPAPATPGHAGVWLTEVKSLTETFRCESLEPVKSAGQGLRFATERRSLERRLAQPVDVVSRDASRRSRRVGSHRAHAGWVWRRRRQRPFGQAHLRAGIQRRTLPTSELPRQAGGSSNGQRTIRRSAAAENNRRGHARMRRCGDPPLVSLQGLLSP